MNVFEASLLGESPEFLAAVRSAQVAAATDVTVLLLGESGTGKEMLARAMHEGSRRSERPFMAINCAALPEALAESELFGHAKGAFTGALSASSGRIRAAEGGTLFLDEVGELPLAIQAKLLRFLETGEVQPVGETASRRADVRIIAATHRDLHREVQAGRFRADLYYRLNVIPLELPPLRERTGDIPLLLSAFTSQLSRQHGLDRPLYQADTLAMLERYSWPGNVRELRNLCERMVILFAGRRVTPQNLPHEIRNEGRGADTAGFVLPTGGIHLEALEQTMIRQALERTQGNRSRAARLLGLTRDTLLYRLKKYAIG
ncbi:MAG: sigma-54 interaction domain-containing protein [Thiohalomonadaceae bacterium]